MGLPGLLPDESDHRQLDPVELGGRQRLGRIRDGLSPGDNQRFYKVTSP